MFLGYEGRQGTIWRLKLQVFGILQISLPPRILINPSHCLLRSFSPPLKLAVFLLRYLGALLVFNSALGKSNVITCSQLNFDRYQVYNGLVEASSTYSFCLRRFLARQMAPIGSNQFSEEFRANVTYASFKSLILFSVYQDSIAVIVTIIFMRPFHYR